MWVDDDKDEKNDSEDQDKSQNDNADDSDDSSDEDDSKDDSDKATKGSHGDEDTEDLLRQYSKDPSSVDPKLRPVLKKLIGIHTKRMQEVSLVKRKAEALDRLALDPEFQKWARSRKQAINKRGTSRRDEDDDDNDSDDDDDDRPLTRKELRQELSSMRKSREEDEQLELDKRELAKFKKDHPDWEVYREPMKEIIDENPRMSYARAYKLAKLELGGDNDSDEERQTKKRANVSKPNRTSGRDAEKKGKGMSLKDAFNLAKKKHGF